MRGGGDVGGIQSYRLDTRTYTVKAIPAKTGDSVAERMTCVVCAEIAQVVTVSQEIDAQSKWFTCKAMSQSLLATGIHPYEHIFSFFMFFSTSPIYTPIRTISPLFCGFSIWFTVVYEFNRELYLIRMNICAEQWKSA